MVTMRRTKRKIKVRREWGKDIGSDINKLHILSLGGVELASRKVAEKVFKIKELPALTHYGRLTKEYQEWLRKRRR